MEKTLKLTLDQAKAMLGKSTELDALINANFSQQELSLKITDRIKTFQDALNYTGESLQDFEERTALDSVDEKAYKKLKVIVLALNEGKSMDYSDTDVYKYYPWFNAAGSGSGFSYYDSYYDSTFSFVGARLCLKSRELAKYAGQQFLKEYNEYINL